MSECFIPKKYTFQTHVFNNEFPWHSPRSLPLFLYFIENLNINLAVFPLIYCFLVQGGS